MRFDLNEYTITETGTGKLLGYHRNYLFVPAYRRSLLDNRTPLYSCPNMSRSVDWQQLLHRVLLPRN